MASRGLVVLGVSGLLVLLAAGDETQPPQSPKATDALRVDGAAILTAARSYWQACEKADGRLKTELHSAADAAHARNDEAEEKACDDALKDVRARIDAEAWAIGTGEPAGPVKPFRFEPPKSP